MGTIAWRPAQREVDERVANCGFAHIAFSTAQLHTMFLAGVRVPLFSSHAGPKRLFRTCGQVALLQVLGGYYVLRCGQVLPVPECSASLVRLWGSPDTLKTCPPIPGLYRQGRFAFSQHC